MPMSRTLRWLNEPVTSKRWLWILPLALLWYDTGHRFYEWAVWDRPLKKCVREHQQVCRIRDKVVVITYGSK